MVLSPYIYLSLVYRFKFGGLICFYPKYSFACWNSNASSPVETFHAVDRTIYIIGVVFVRCVFYFLTYY